MLLGRQVTFFLCLAVNCYATTQNSQASYVSCVGPMTQIGETLVRSREQTVTGHVEYRHSVYSRFFDNERTIAVYLPPQYAAEVNRRFSVLYALDGNNLFSSAAGGSSTKWDLDKTLERLIRAGELPPVIVVGITGTERRNEELLCGDGFWRNRFIEGRADEFAEFIKGTIKPLIDRNYRTLTDREHTALMGSSFGGIFALYAAWKYSDMFSRFAAMSPGFFWNDHIIYQVLQEPISQLPQRLWIDMGDNEGWTDGPEFHDGVNELNRAYDILLEQGMDPGTQLRRFVQKGGIHHESAWGARMERVLKFILN